MKSNMKFLHSILGVLAVSTIAISTANARDSFSLGINIGGHGHDYYAPPVVYHAPRVIYYDAPSTYYYQPIRSYYHAPPIVSYQYYGGHGYRHHSQRDDRGYGYNNGWNNGNRGNDRGRHNGHYSNRDDHRDRGHH